MTFTNVEIDLETLPRSADVDFHDLHPRYARVVLGVTLAFLAPLALLALVGLLSVALRSAIASIVLAVPVAIVFGFLAWFSYKSARVMRYALRQHDVIVQSGVFWKKETVQPIRRIQHVEQHQGPVDKRFGLYELKLFSAGTAYLTFRIPGLDADTASRIRQFILNVQEDGWGSDEPMTPVAAAAHDNDAVKPAFPAHSDEPTMPAAARSDSDG